MQSLPAAVVQTSNYVVVDTEFYVVHLMGIMQLCSNKNILIFCIPCSLSNSFKIKVQNCMCSQSQPIVCIFWKLPASAATVHGLVLIGCSQSLHYCSSLDRP